MAAGGGRGAPLGTSEPVAAPHRTLDELRTALADCRRCGHPEPIVPIVSLAVRPRAMLVGQAPGKVEISSRKPFSGRAGRTLFRWLARAGLDEEEARRKIYISAMTRCFPGAHPSGRGDRVPGKAELEQCRSWLESELMLLRPKVIIPVGKLAIENFLGPVVLSDVVGKAHEIENVGGRSLLIPLPHPSGASSWIHAPGHMALVDQALRLIGEQLRRANS
ncbi:MAG TPA: uracil-DNA glycosylase family protein [Gemmatimonadaceae bacterium]|nr:uracil-DNA glycosylase family protein [Gemmatimonadaceae bacterium]